MEVSMHMINYKLEKMAPHIHKTSHKKRLFTKNMIISCQVSMQTTEKTNFYQLLSLNSKNVGFDEIKKAYKTMALQYHPDVCSINTPLTKEESTKRFVELRKAYETLSDPNSRSMYDYELGFGDSLGFHFEKRNSNFSREVWERQLNGLRKRSSERTKKRRYN